MQTVFDKNGTQIQLPEKQDTFTNTNNKFKSVQIGEEKEFVVGLGSLVLSNESDIKNTLKGKYFEILSECGPGTYLFTYQVGGSLGSCIMTCVTTTYGGFIIFGYVSISQVVLNNGVWNG